MPKRICQLSQTSDNVMAPTLDGTQWLGRVTLTTLLLLSRQLFTFLSHGVFIL